jgi:hypothetical protein
MRAERRSQRRKFLAAHPDQKRMSKATDCLPQAFRIVHQAAASNMSRRRVDRLRTSEWRLSGVLFSTSVRAIAIIVRHPGHSRGPAGLAPCNTLLQPYPSRNFFITFRRLAARRQTVSRGSVVVRSPYETFASASALTISGRRADPKDRSRRGFGLPDFSS